MKNVTAGLVGAVVGGAIVWLAQAMLHRNIDVRPAPVEEGSGEGAAAGAEPSGARRAAEARRSSPAGAAGAPGTAGAAGDERPVDELLPAEIKARYVALLGEVVQLRERLDAVEGPLHRAVDKDRGVRPYDLPKEQLLALADRCALTWDMPSLNDRATMSHEDVRALALGDPDRAAIDRVLADNDAYMKAELRKLYVEVTGDENGAGSLAAQTLWHEIEDKSPKELVRQAFQRLSAERAGLAKPPPDPRGATPIERLYRLLTTAGDRVEKSIAAQVGTDLARRYRDLQNGFSSRNTSSFGCP